MSKMLRTVKAALVAAIAFTAVPDYAWALSCLQPNLANSYRQWAESETQYVIVRGVLRAAGKLPAKRTNSVDDQHNEFLKAVPYIFSGVMIGKNKSSPISVKVIVEPQCFAVWCGGYPEGNDEALYAFEKTENGYRFRPTPCGGDSFTGNTRKHEHFVRQCMQSGTCGG